MGFNVVHQPGFAAVGATALAAGQGQYNQWAAQFGQNQQQIDQNYELNRLRLDQSDRQFDADLGFRGQQLAQQDRQFAANYGLERNSALLNWNQFGEGQRQFDADLGFRNQQLEQQQSQFDTSLQFEAGQAQKNRQLQQFTQLISEAGAIQRQREATVASQQMAMFEQQSRMQQMAYGNYLNQQNAYTQFELDAGMLGLRNAAELEQFNKLAEQQRQQQAFKLQSDMQSVMNNPDYDQPTKDYIMSQLQAQSMGLKSSDPTAFMSFDQKEAYKEAQAAYQAQEFNRQVQSMSGGKGLDYLYNQGIIPLNTPDGMKILQSDPKWKSEIQMQERIEVEKIKAETKKSEILQTKQQEMMKAIAGAKSGTDDKGNTTYDPLQLNMIRSTFKGVYPDDFDWSPYIKQSTPTIQDSTSGMFMSQDEISMLRGMRGQPLPASRTGALQAVGNAATSSQGQSYANDPFRTSLMGYKQ